MTRRRGGGRLWWGTRKVDPGGPKHLDALYDEMFKAIENPFERVDQDQFYNKCNDILRRIKQHQEHLEYKSDAKTRLEHKINEILGANIVTTLDSIVPRLN
jgi:hypothetical protein